jgi:ribokinase
MAKRKLKVAGLGQCSLDYLALASKYAKEDRKEEILDWSVQGGGPVATALVTLARLGVDTRFSGIVAGDDAGRLIREGLKREGVNTRLLKTRKLGKSQRAFIVVSKRLASRTIYWQRPTVKELSEDEVRLSLLKDADMLILDGLLESASLRAAELANAKKIPVLLDAGSLREETLKLAELSDYIVCSERFAKEYAGTPAKALLRLSKLKPKAATITLGKRGSVTWTEGRKFKTPAFKVHAIDTTGAGDVFHGAYAYGIINNLSVEKTLQFASATAALKCRELGGRLGIPKLAEILKLMTTN